MQSSTAAALAPREPHPDIDELMFKAPVVRAGCLVFPEAPPSGKKHHPLDYAQGEKAVEGLIAKIESFDAALRRSIEKGLDELGVPYRLLENAPAGIDLNDPRRGENLGAVFDFSEIAFLMDGALVIARACVTVCVQGHAIEPRKKEGQSAARAFNYSKFWTRFIYCGDVFTSPRRDSLSLRGLREFDRRCRSINQVAIRLMREPYECILRDVINDQSLVIGIGSQFLAVAAAADSSDFHPLYTAIRAGVELEEFPETNSVADQLVQMGLSYFPGPSVPASATLKEKMETGVALIPYEGTDFYRGLFFRHAKDGVAEFVGIGRAPVGADEARDVNTKPSHGAANVVSAGLISVFATLF